MKLALFDLDHTLIPFDSGMAWTRHLVRAGALAAGAESRYLDFCHQYVAGTLDIHAMHRASLAPLAAFAPQQLQRWAASFEAELAGALPQAMLDLVTSHRQQGDLCAIVTATSRLVAAPFARAFGIENLLATEAVQLDGIPTGEIAGALDAHVRLRARHQVRVRLHQRRALRAGKAPATALEPVVELSRELHAGQDHDQTEREQRDADRQAGVSHASARMIAERW